MFCSRPFGGAISTELANLTLVRTRGSSWRFHTFYAAYREQVALRIVMPNVHSLSMYSPMLVKRPVEQGATPAAGWERAQMQPPSTGADCAAWPDAAASRDVLLPRAENVRAADGGALGLGLAAAPAASGWPSAYGPRRPHHATPPSSTEHTISPQQQKYSALVQSVKYK